MLHYTNVKTLTNFYNGPLIKSVSSISTFNGMFLCLIYYKLNFNKITLSQKNRIFISVYSKSPVIRTTLNKAWVIQNSLEALISKHINCNVAPIFTFCTNSKYKIKFYLIKLEYI